MDQGLKRGGSVTGAGASARAAPVRVASSVTAPLHRIPPPPPPKATAATTTRGQQQASRYRSLRGKSISSPVRANKLIIYSDQTGSDDGVNTVSQGSPTRNRKRRSKSVVEKTHRLFPADLQATAKENGRPSTGINSAAAGATTGNLNTSSTTSKLSPLLPINLPLKNRCPNLSSSTPSTPQGTDWKTLDNYKPASLLRLKEASSPLQQQKGVAIYQPQFGKENQIPVHRDGGVPWADEVARLEAETDRILAEQKKCDLARLEAQLAAAPSPKSKTKPKPKQLILDTFPFLSKRPNGTGHSGPNTPKSAPAKTLGFPWSPTFSLGDKSPSPFAMSFIEYGGGGTVPQIDAPTSAINGGERVSQPIPVTRSSRSQIN